MVTLAGDVSLTHLRLLACWLWSAAFVHLEKSKQICTSDILDRTTGVLKLLFPHSRLTAKKGLMQLVLSKREIIARQPVYLAIKLT
jgi:hypothetical protein